MSDNAVEIRAMVPEDAGRVLAIYQAGIETGHATFESVAPDWREFDEKYLPECRLVAAMGREVVGWIALTPVSKRAVYRGVAEHSIYISANARGKGVGGSCSKRWYRPPNVRVSGPCRPASSPRTRPASICMRLMVFAFSDAASGSPR
jgi:hypothetical protein